MTSLHFTFPHFKVVVGTAAMLLLYALVLATTPGSRAQEPEGNFGVGIPDVFLPKYLAFRDAQLASGSPDVMRIKLGYVKGLSTSFTSMVGELAINLETSAFEVSLNGLTPLVTYRVWLLDRTESELEPPLLPDIPFGLVTFLATGASALLTGVLPLNVLPPTAPSLGAAQSFAVLGASTVTSTGASVITGDLGVSPGTAVTGFPPGLVASGTIHSADAAAFAAQEAVTAAYNSLADKACTQDMTGQDLGGQTLTAGVYCFSSSAQLTGTLTLNALGNANAVFIFKMGSTLTTASASSVALTNGGSPGNVFWHVGSSATLGTGTSFAGNILALASITVTTGARVDGRTLARHGAVTLDTSAVTATSQLTSVVPTTFTIDQVVVTEGTLWGSQPLGAGTVNVFQKIFFRRLSLLNESSNAPVFEETTTPPALFELVPDLAAETDAMSWMGPKPMAPGPSLRFATFSLQPARAMAMRRTGNGFVKLDKLISQGAKLFFENTFQGNGRTCGTCHPANNNFMIDPEFIATLPANNPLFVAEFNPALAQLEKPQLMRSFGLILENLDGLQNPTVKFVMRGVPHTLGMQVSLKRDVTQVPTPAEMTGWSGDGAPGTGSLRDFATGAVTQHFTKRLNRVVGTDFKLPKEHQLDALEAFQLSLGREKDFVLANITFQDANVQTGKNLFVNGTGDPNAGGVCIACHVNAGALATNLQNRNFNTNVEDVVHPARSIQNFPKDGGFGLTNNGDGTFGNRAFNTASVVEAADTPPFFHNNVVSTLEGVVDFYSGPEFNNPRAAAARFNFNQAQRDKVADFMRGINVLQNIDVAKRELKEILDNNNNPQREQATRLQTAFEEVQDSIDVLTDGNIFPTAKTRLTEARNLISQAQFTGDSGQKRALIQQAITKLGQARALVAT